VAKALARVDDDLRAAGGEMPLTQMRESPLEVPETLDETGESPGLPTSEEPAA
jgi:hypothetical protein